MERKLVLISVIVILLTNLFGVAYKIEKVLASETIYIRADGSIDPPDAPMITFDYVTYTLTDNITSSADGIVVERNNIILNGAGCILQGPGTAYPGFAGIRLGERSNVTIKNTSIENYWEGIYLYSSSCNTFLANNISSIGHYAMHAWMSHNNTFRRNNILNNGRILHFGDSNNNIFEKNIIKSNGLAEFESSSGNILVDNTMDSNDEIYFVRNPYSGPCTNNILVNNSISNSRNGKGISFRTANDNKIYHNNFLNNSQQIVSIDSTNVWNDGYPSGGNYWSDYTDVDLYSGSYQNETGNDGIWDHPYVIDADNQDNYPLVDPWTPTCAYVQGVDVSHHQGDINWTEVYGEGYRFAFAKASEGFGWEDPLFIANMDNGSDAGLLMGTYHLARPDLGWGGVEEAIAFLDAGGDYLGNGYLRPVLRLSTGSSLGIDELSEWVIRWMETVKDNTSIEPIIQTNSDYANYYLNASIAQYDLWITDWTYDTTVSPDTGIWSDWAFWQYSNLGSVPGISGNVFLDVFNGDMNRISDDFLICADLSVTIDWISNHSPVEGEPVTINVTVTNIGQGPSESGNLILSQHIDYDYPYPPFIEDINLYEESLPSLNPQESRNFTFIWYAVEIVNDNSGNRLSVSTSYNLIAHDASPSDNTIYLDLEVDDTSGFDISRDAFSFSNGDQDISAEEYFNEINQELLDDLGVLFPSTTSMASINCIRALVLSGGLCHGISRSSIIYYKFPNEKPVEKETFNMLKEEVIEALISSSELPNVASVVSDWSAGFTMDLSAEFAKIVENLGKDQPVIMRIGYPSSGGKEHHSLVVFNYYSVSDDIKNIVVYDPNLPGTAIIVVFNLASNTAYTPTGCPMIYEDIRRVYIHVPGVRERAKDSINSFFKSLEEDVKRVFTFNCPINVTFTDQYGRIISEVENEIPGAEFEYFNLTDTRIFYLPLNLSYSVRIIANDFGNCTICQITPVGTHVTSFSYDMLSLTNQTVSEFNVTAFDANYTLHIDEDGDGVFEHELVTEPEPHTSEWDVGVVEVEPLKTIVGEGYPLRVNATVVNYGIHNETFNVTVYANMTTLMTYTITALPGANYTAMTLTCNTTGLTKGYYTVSSVADVIPGETCIVDNTLEGSSLMVTIAGDTDGDRDVDIFDIVRITTRYQMTYPDPNWDPNADIIENGRIDIFDIVAACSHYGESW